MKRIGLALALVCLTACGGAVESPSSDETQQPPWFVEQAAERGLNFTYRSGHDGRHLFREIVGGGAALFDMDGDGDLDAYLVQGEGENRLFENDGSGRFADVTEGSGANDGGYGMGVAAGDYDNDGDVDLYVTNVGPNALLRNDGGGRFSDVTTAAGAAGNGWGTSALFVDHDRDGDLDLFVANYINWSPETESDCYNTAGQPDYCLPNHYNAPAIDTLLRNNGDGSFRDVTVELGLNRSFGNGLGAVADDFTGDGRIDLFVANDVMLNQLWVQQPDGSFVDESLMRGCALDEHGIAKSGMGVDAEDFDADGDVDLIVVNLETQTDSFFRNDGGTFKDRTGSIGLGTDSRTFTRFGIGLVDFNHDGAFDLYHANGRVTRTTEPFSDDPYAEPNMIFEGTSDGRLHSRTPRGGTLKPTIASSRGAAFGDVDGDGAVDVLVVNRDAPASLFLNVVEQRGHWLRIRALEKNGRDAIGARLRLEANGTAQQRSIRSGYSYCSANEMIAHFGLGSITQVDRLVVTWPDGEEERYGPFDADQLLTLRQGEGS